MIINLNFYKLRNAKMKTHTGIFLFILIISLLTGCSTTSMLSLSPDEQSYLNEAQACPLEFYVPKTDAEDAWGRAQSFIGQYSSMKLQTVTDYVIETYNPRMSDVAYGYSVTKTPMNDLVRISVRCFCGNFLEGDNTSTNAHILAYYIKTGNEFSPRLVSR
jgi:hypothetical protein